MLETNQCNFSGNLTNLEIQTSVVDALEIFQMMSKRLITEILLSNYKPSSKMILDVHVQKYS